MRSKSACFINKKCTKIFSIQPENERCKRSKQEAINIFLVKTKEIFVSGKGFDDEASDYSVGT